MRSLDYITNGITTGQHITNTPDLHRFRADGRCWPGRFIDTMTKPTEDKAQNISRLISRIDSFVSCLDKRKDIGLHSQVDQFYYMTKAAELRFLLNQYQDVAREEGAVLNRMNVKYKETFTRWQKDIRWANRHLSERGLSMCSDDLKKPSEI